MMTREEELKHASDTVGQERWEKGDTSPHGMFMLGAKWADEHPKSPWISVKERLPEEG